jgi:hypothetical protein
MFLINPQLWDLRTTPSSIIRRKVTAARHAGASVTEERGDLIPALLNLYPQTLSRFGARSKFSPETLERWASDSGNIVIGASRAGRVEAVQLIHVHGTHAEVHLFGVSETGRPLSAMLYASALERLKAMAIQCCNLGGGGHPGDGLFRFKSWLGALAVPHHAVRHIYDPGQFAALCKRAGVATESAWFPPYRLITAAQANG